MKEKKKDLNLELNFINKKMFRKGFYGTFFLFQIFLCRGKHQLDTV